MSATKVSTLHFSARKRSPVLWRYRFFRKVTSLIFFTIFLIVHIQKLNIPQSTYLLYHYTFSSAMPLLYMLFESPRPGCRLEQSSWLLGCSSKRPDDDLQVSVSIQGTNRSPPGLCRKCRVGENRCNAHRAQVERHNKDIVRERIVMMQFPWSLELLSKSGPLAFSLCSTPL